MGDEYTFEEPNFNVPTILVHGNNQIVWQTENPTSESFATTPNNTLSESYMTATDGENTLSESYMTVPEGDNTQYLSVLETSSETILNNISHIENDNNFTFEQSTEEQTTTSASTSDDVVIFRVDGSDELYGLQVAEDEEGNVRRYQFQVIQNAEGQFETVPGTIQIMANEDEVLPMAIPSEIPELPSQESEPDENVEPHNNDDTALTEKVFVKQELVMEDMLDEEANTPEDQLQVDEENYREDDEEYQPEDNYNDDIDIDEIDTKEGIVIANNERKLSKIHKKEPDDYDYEGSESPNEMETSVTTENGDEEIIPDKQTDAISPYEHIYIDQQEQSAFQMQDGELNNETADESTRESNVEHITSDVDISGITELIRQEHETMNSGESDNSDYANQNVEDNGSDSEYEIDGAHITGEEENLQFYQEVEQMEPLETKIRKTNILSKPIKDKLMKNSKIPERNSYYLLKYTEKENVETDSRANLIISKTNTRSILKTTHKTVIEEKQPIIEKRFLKSKEASQARKYQNMISQTTIIHAPVRQERLPRKQQIKPSERLGEEIVVQEVFVSSNGYIETREDGVLKNRKPLIPSDFIQLSDSDDERKKKRKRKPKRRKSLIVISDTDEETEKFLNNVLESPPKKPRGRKPKNKNLEPLKNANKSATELKKLENQCTKCPKSFPSLGSLRTHMQYHNFEVSKKLEFEKEKLRTEAVAKVEPSKHVCILCQETFKNNILLVKHTALHKNPNKFECQVCKKIFTDRLILSTHKRIHVKDKMFKSTTSLKLSPKKAKLLMKPIKSPKKQQHLDPLTCIDCGKVFSTLFLLKSHSKSHKRFKCTNCSLDFLSKLLLDMHILHDCVKRKVALPPKVRVSYVPRKSVNRALTKRITRSSMIPPPSTSKLKTTALNIKVKCDSCDSVFNTHTKLFRHKVVEHNLETPDKTIGKETAKKSLYKPIPDHSGIMPNERLRKTFAKLRNILEHQDTEEK